MPSTTATTLAGWRRSWLTIVPPDFDFYVRNSKALIAILNDYTPDVEQYSIDEAFLDMTGTEALFGSPLTAAHTIRRRVRRELGFTVNVGIAPNRLLAKMAWSRWHWKTGRCCAPGPWCCPRARAGAR